MFSESCDRGGAVRVCFLKNCPCHRLSCFCYVSSSDLSWDTFDSELKMIKDYSYISFNVIVL